jgi:hypothetical protein
MNPQQAQFLNLRRLPARVYYEQAGWLLGFTQVEIALLVSKRLLAPLGKPPQNGTKYMATTTLLELAQDPVWLSKASAAITMHWRNRHHKLAQYAEGPKQ